VSQFDADEAGSVPDLDTLEVAHTSRSTTTADQYGGRSNRNGQLRHMNNTVPPTPGWLGNPHEMDEDTVEERRRVIAAFARDFLDRVESDAQFRDAVRRLEGKRVSCWCRGVTQPRRPDNWCHLDVVAAWLAGDLSPVYCYLRGAEQ